MSTTTEFDALEADIRKQSKTTKQLGDAFELVALYYFTHAPKYKGVFRHIWLWNDCPHVSGADLGIDLVAEDSDGKFWAIQSKGYAAETQITKADIDSFISASDQSLFHGRITPTT
jgi:predicted helicase